MVERDLAKVRTRVRFSYPAPVFRIVRHGPKGRTKYSWNLPVNRKGTAGYGRHEDDKSSPILWWL